MLESGGLWRTGGRCTWLDLRSLLLLQPWWDFGLSWVPVELCLTFLILEEKITA